jgi:hypothetical protein
MKIWITFLFLFFVYGLFFALPIKIKICKKNKRILSSAEIMQLEKNGDEDAVKLGKKRPYLLTLGFLFVLFFVLDKHKIFSF